MNSERKKDHSETVDVLDLLLDKKIQKQIKKVNPTFNRAELVAAILEEWGGQNNFAKDVYREFCQAPVGSVARTKLMDRVMVLICDESKNDQSRDVDSMTDEELNRAIVSITPGLKAYTKEEPDAE